MIDPTAVSTIRVGELSPEPFSLTDNIPHEVGTELKRGSIEDLATFISAFIGSTDGVGFRAISVTDGQTLPTTTQQEFILVGKGTYYNVVGGSTIICTEELNAIVSNGSYWFIGVEIPVNVELAGITQFIRDGFISTTPSEDAVYDALALKANVADSEDVTNKISTISTYSTTLYPNEKATHDALDLKLNIADLPTNLTLYPTNVASDVSGYVKMVTDIHAPDYNTVAVDVSTPAITGTGQLVASLITDAGVLIGQPGIFNATTFGNIRRLSGSGTSTFYFKVFHRDSIETETLIGTSSNTEVITSSSYLEFTGALLWDDGNFIATDRIVIKYYANRIAGGSDPVYQFQFGGITPVRTLLPVPFSVVDAGYELKVNKQNDLTIDGTGTKYPTVDAVNAIDLQKVVDVNGYATVTGTGSKYGAFYLDETGASMFGSNSTGNNYSEVGVDNGQILLSSQYLTKKTSIAFDNAIENTSLNFPAKTVAGTYTLATTDIVSQTITNGVTDKSPSEDVVFDALALKENLFDKTLYTNAYINNGRLVCNDVNSTTTAHYLGLELDTSIPQWLKAGVIWETGTTGALIAIISNPNGNKKLADITSKSLHISFTDTKFEVGYFNAGVLTVTHTYTYPVACLRDNSTEYTFGWRATDTQLIIYAGAYTQTYNYSTDGIDYRTYCGKYAIFEHYYTGTGKARPQFNWIETRNNTPVVMIDNFNRPNGAPMQNGFGYVYSQFTNLTSGGNSVVDVRLKSYTVATLPLAVIGDTAFVTDALAPTYLGALVGGGAIKCPVFYNGTAWVSH